jgi:phosphatidylglycerophosphate synthase
MLHTRQAKADWEYIAPGERNIWQRFAARTHGVITPANSISVVGFVAVCVGVYSLTQQRYALGLCLTVVGRLADLADGIIAERTQTKSSLGEALDVTIDKIVLIIMVWGLIVMGLPGGLIALLLISSSLNILAGMYAKLAHITLNPSRYGKYATALAWMGIVCFILTKLSSASLWSVGMYISFGLYAIAATVAGYRYTQQILKR